MGEIELAYGDNPYHNSTHASSVVHFMHAMLSSSGLLEVVAQALAADPELVRMACLLAAVVHDYDHVGVSNDFLVNSKNARALRYNDQSVNEQHHAAAAFDVLSRPECNFLAELPAKSFKQLRSLVIKLVVGTDMAEHGAMMKAFKELPVAPATLAQEDGEAHCSSAGCNLQLVSEKDAVLVLQVAMKCADLGHLTLDWDDHVEWVELLDMEFFAQGDREKELGIPVSFLMDREKPGASETQVGFFDFMVLPLFRTFTNAIPSCTPLLEGVLLNYEQWQLQDGQTAVGRTRSMGASPLNSDSMEALRLFGKGGLEAQQRRRRRVFTEEER